MKNIWIAFSLILLLLGCSRDSDKQKQIDAIDKEIHTLQTELEGLRLKEMNTDVKSQGMMIADWSAYAKDVEQLRKDENAEKELESHIKTLQEQKTRLLAK